MLYYIPNLFVTMPLVLGVKSRWEGNVSRLCGKGSEGLVHLPGALAMPGTAR